ncbi:MAG: hypothetical protein NC400_07655 [Clostridium sp.]|nr:hypothetical protein [Clostridium sp.]
MKKTNLKKQGEDGSMSLLTQYLESNREHAYALATENMRYDKHGRPTVSKDDEWLDETEWDDLFHSLADEKRMEK